MIKGTSYEHLENFISIDKLIWLFPVVILDKVIDILDTVALIPPNHYVSGRERIEDCLEHKMHCKGK
jgi:hypothetical protein